MSSSETSSADAAAPADEPPEAAETTANEAEERKAARTATWQRRWKKQRSVVSAEEIGGLLLDSPQSFRVVGPSPDPDDPVPTSSVSLWDSPFLYGTVGQVAAGTRVVATARYERGWADFYLVESEDGEIRG